VWEWTSSVWADYPYDATHESASDVEQARVMRGGAFDGGSDLQRAAYREWHSPDFESYAIGFRCVRP
jgi:formylglycine-generating enzyme required for sulfatase activity